MTFLCFAFFASLICISQCMPVDLIPPIPDVAVTNYQEQIEGFLKEISAAAETHLQPLITKMDASDQQQVVEFGINSFMNYIEYVLRVLTVSEDEKIAKQSVKVAEDALDDTIFDESLVGGVFVDAN